MRRRRRRWSSIWCGTTLQFCCVTFSCCPSTTRSTVLQESFTVVYSTVTPIEGPRVVRMGPIHFSSQTFMATQAGFSFFCVVTSLVYWYMSGFAALGLLSSVTFVVIGWEERPLKWHMFCRVWHKTSNQSVSSSLMMVHGHVLQAHVCLVDNIWTVMPVCRRKRKIIRTVPCRCF